MKAKKKQHMIISSDREKPFDKFQIDAEKHLTKFHDKNIQKTGNRRKLPQHNKSFMKNSPKASYSMVKEKSISSKIRNKARMPTFITSVQHSTGSSSQSN